MTETQNGLREDRNLGALDPDYHDIRVRFGTRPTQVIPLPWAEIMLTELKTRQPVLFGKLLVIAADGAK